MATPTYAQSRVLLLTAGSAVLLVTALVLLLRAYDPTEVLAVVLFLPVFAAAVLGGARWGAVFALLAGFAYVVVRVPDLQQFGWSALSGRILTQFLGYLVFGAVGGWAAGVVTAGIVKLDRFDVRDDDSQLLNARGLHEQLGAELARAQRYGSTFSVVSVQVTLTGDVRRLRQVLGDVVRRSMRVVDEPGRVTIDDSDIIITVLPETPAEGAEVAGTKIGELLAAQAPDVVAQITRLSHPDDEATIVALLDQLEEVVRREHPEGSSRS